MGYRYSPPRPTLPAPPRVHPSPTPLVATSGYTGARARVPRLKVAVGLISVAQLTLDGRFSESRGITEVYNLVETDRIHNHFLIPGNK